MVVPAELKPGVYDVAIRAELRSMDNQTTVVEANTAARRLDLQPPLELQVTTPADAAIQLDPKHGASFTMNGSIKRLADFAGPVTMTLAGLPTAITAPRQVLKPTEDKYELTIKLPAMFVGDKLEALQVVASLGPEARRPTVLTQVGRPLPAIRIERPQPPAPADKAATATAAAPAK